jgi:hypothetical protein
MLDETTSSFHLKSIRISKKQSQIGFLFRKC